MSQEKSLLVTFDEAIAKGLRCSKPEMVACPYCGKATIPLGIVLDGFVRWVAHVPCGCPEGIEAQRAKAEKESEEAEARLRSRLLGSGIGKRFIDAEVSLEASARYLSSFEGNGGAGLYIEGRVGSGKTYAASAIAKAFVMAGYSVVVATTISMLEEIKRSYDDRAAIGINRYISCDVLVMDDIGKETASSWALTNLFQIVNSRYEDMRPTIYTSQYDVDSLAMRMTRYGDKESAEAIVSRIVETSTFVRLPDRDRRRQKGIFGGDGTRGTL